MQLTINGEPREIERARTIADLLEELELSEQRLAVERNGEIVPRSSHAETALNEGDQLEIVHAVGGG